MRRIHTRRTVRNGLQRRELAAGDVQRLISVFGEHAGFYAPSSRVDRYLAEGTVEANRVQAEHDAAQAELASWTRFSNSSALAHRDGLTQESMEIHGVAGWYVRNFFETRDVMSRSYRRQGVDRVRHQVTEGGGWIIVTSPDTRIATLIETGRQLERAWLGLRERGIGIHPMTQMLEEAPLSAQIGREIGLGVPVQFILRVGYVAHYPDPVSLRRPVEEFVVRSA